MKYRSHAANSIVYVGAMFAIVSAAVALVLLLMSSLGMIFPRRGRIVLATDSCEKVYDGTPLLGGDVYVADGELHPGHSIKILAEESFTEVGVYENSPAYVICDDTGSDVSDMYEIYCNFGELKILGRPISVHLSGETKVYDGKPLESGIVKHTGGKLAEGHRFVPDGVSSITEPGELQIGSHYRIEDASGVDVTSQYNVSEEIGVLKVTPINLTLSSGSGNKYYDGTPLSKGSWRHVGGRLLSGHSLLAECTAEITDVGTVENTLDVRVLSSDGADVSHLYQFTKILGELTVSPLPLYIKTGSVSRSYDGTPVSYEKWTLSGGTLCAGDTLAALSTASVINVGTRDNVILFAVKNAEGEDVSYRYDIKSVFGTITVTPRALTIRTGSAQKVYDGTALVCEEYEIISGSLCAGERIELSFASLVNIGYMQNYVVDYSILRDNADGSVTDVTGNYRMSYDYGFLTVTAK